MHKSWCATSARIIVPIEALGGITLYIVLIVALWRTDIGKAARVYRITILITALLGAYFALLLLLIEVVFILVDGIVIDVLYGSILNYLPERINDVLVIAFFSQAHTLWQLLPGSSIVQWMNLAKPNTSTIRRLVLAYTVPVICNVNTWQGIDLLAIILCDVLPSYVICYGIFTFCAVQIQFRLRSYGTTASRKTENMQRRFFRSQIIQVLLPFILTAVPICTALIAVLGGLNLANASVLLSYSMWLMPSATASLFLIFVAKSSAKRTVRTPNASTAKVEKMRPEEARKISMILRKSSFNPTDRVAEVVPQCS